MRPRAEPHQEAAGAAARAAHPAGAMPRRAQRPRAVASPAGELTKWGEALPLEARRLAGSSRRAASRSPRHWTQVEPSALLGCPLERLRHPDPAGPASQLFPLEGGASPPGRLQWRGDALASWARGPLAEMPASRRLLRPLRRSPGLAARRSLAAEFRRAGWRRVRGIAPVRRAWTQRRRTTPVFPVRAAARVRPLPHRTG